ncbi:brain acid soluble protein 1 [Stieleria mannarensis]|uniref:brain acid soluble protein 1 n=1 Tax=Stieleria mannarensis TaxID=2755585 RepID=UPI001603D6EE|nr:brain acid soluble protein 1 [Rhodopirellula sp. JC639]
MTPATTDHFACRGGRDAASLQHPARVGCQFSGGRCGVPWRLMVVLIAVGFSLLATRQTHGQQDQQAPLAVEQPAEGPQPETDPPTAEPESNDGPPSAEEPSAEEPSAEEPSAEEPSAEEPSAEEPSAEEPSAEEPSAEVRTAEESMDKAADDEAPAIDSPESGSPEGEPAAAGGNDPLSGDDASSPLDRWTLPLPLRDRDGRPLRPIGIFLSQIVDLVPAEFRAVSIRDLQQAIGNGAERFADSNQARLVSGFYDIRLDENLLVSEGSKLVLEHKRRPIIRRKLGAVNLAISGSPGGLRSPLSAGRGNLPRLEIDYSGELVAVIPGTPPAAGFSAAGEPSDGPAGTAAVAPSESDAAAGISDGWSQSEIRFGWTLRSQSVGAAKRFDLRLPRTSQTRLVISTPSDIVLESKQGVLVERPGPPPDADVQTRTGDIRWYVLEAGGLNRLEIDARRRSEGEANQPLFIRRESKQYEVDLSGVSWIHRMTLQFPRQRNRLRLRLPLGTVTAIRANSVEAPYQVLRRQDGQSLIDVDLPGGLVGVIDSVPENAPAGALRNEPASELLTLTIEGTSNWNLSDGHCELPSVTPDEPNVLWTEASTQTIVAVMDPLEVAQWDLPPTWRQSIQTPTRAGETLLIADGPPPQNAQPDAVGSRLTLIEKEERFIEAVWTRLRVQPTPAPEVRANSRIRCRLLQNHQSPFHVDVNPDWTVDSVTVVGSGRRITVPVDADRWVIWPTPSEAAQATLEIEVIARKNLPRNRNRLTMASTWIVRPVQHVGEHVISIQPPPLRRWDGNSVMLQGRFESSTMDEESIAFFQPTSETLLIRSPTGEIPEVTLEPVDDSFGVALRHVIETEGNDVSETIIVRAETTQPISELSVLTGNARQEAFSWSLRRTDQSATVSLPGSSVQRVPADPLGTYVITLEGRDLRQFELVGRRFFPVQDRLTLSLPSVRRTRGQTAEVTIDASWEISQIPPGVQLVPGTETNQATWVAGDQPQYLRYEPLLRPEIRLRRARPEAAACLIWNQRFEVVANSRNEDLFHLTAEVSTRKPIHVSYDHELEIVSVSRNGVRRDPDRSEVGEIWIDPERQSDQIAVLMRRRHSSSDWFRRCQVPRVEVKGNVIRQQVSYQSGPGSLLLHRTSNALADPSVPSGRGTVLILVARDVAIGLGWLVATVVFFLAWSIARCFSLGVHCLFVLTVLSISGAVIWWPAQTAIVGWIAVPLSAAALLHVVMADRWKKTVTGTGASGALRLDDTRSQQAARDRSADFSVSVPHSVLALVIGASATMGGGLMAQESSGEDARRDSDSGAVETAANDPIELLVPLDPSYVPVGDKVYMSRADYESIRSDVDPDRPVDAQFQSAEYRVVLAPPRDAADSITVEVQADYQIQLLRESTRVRLPVRADLLRRIELVSDGETQIIRFTVDERGMVTAAIPSSRQSLLRLTYLPSVSTLGAGPGIVGGDGAGGGGPPWDERDAGQPLADRPMAGGVMAGGVEAGGVEAGGVENLDAASGLAATVIRLAIPPIHAAKLIVEAPREIQVESLGDPLGRSLFRAELGRYEADLGPVRELAIRCRAVKRPGQAAAPTLRRAYRISAGIESTIVECEITPEDSLREGDALQLTILGGPSPSLTCLGWAMEEAELADSPDRPAGPNASPGSGIYRFEKQSSVDTPIRLLWRLPSVLNDPTSTEDSKTMPIPEVFSSAAQRWAATLFAIESAASIRVSELAKGSKPASEDEFLAAWRGYPGKIQRAFVIQDAFPSFVLLQDKFPTPTARLNHRLHVAESKMELRLKADLVDLRPSLQRIRITIPPRFRLVRCLVNDEPITSMTPLLVDTPAGIRAELSIGDNRINGATKIELLAESRMPIRGRSLLPRFTVSSDGQTRETYRITRERSLDVRMTRPDAPQLGEENVPGGEDEPGTWKPAALTQDDLLAGQIPVVYAEFSGTPPEDDPIVVSRRAAGSVFACDQITRMRYADGQWFCDTLLELPGRLIPDYVDLTLPTRWAADLDVSGAAVWGKRQSSDDVVTVVRVAVPGQVVQSARRGEDVRRVQVTGSLKNRDQVRVSVPAINVLDAKLRDQLIAVPGQLTTQAIQWRAQSVRSIKPDPNVFASFQNEVESPERYSFYAPIESNWSVELEPLLQATINPVALCCDARVFLDSDHALVMQRFDILPETRNEVTVALPVGASCIGVWSAGREVDLSELPPGRGSPDEDSDEDSDDLQASRLRVPLAYSRLPQSLEVLVEVPVSGRAITNYLSELVDVPTRDRWVTFYLSPLVGQNRQLTLDRMDSEADQIPGNSVQQRSARAFALAQSVVTAIDRSRDMLAERSDDEIKRWLLPWIARYQAIASRSGHTFRIVSASGEDAIGAAATATNDITNRRSDGAVADAEQGSNQAPLADVDPDAEKRWQAYDRQLLQLVGRFLQSNPRLPQTLFAQHRFSEFEVASIVRLESFADGPVLVQSFTQRESLQDLLVNAITLVTFGLAVILMWPFRGRFQTWIHEPAVWLFILGTLGLFLIPIPLAVTLMVIAVTVPLINRMKSKSVPTGM